MTISAISSTYSSYQHYENQFFGSTISVERLQSLLKEYGITATGDAYKDVLALYQVMYKEATSETQGNTASPYDIKESGSLSKNEAPSQATTAENSTNVPWASLMNQLGLYVSGDIEEDYAAFTSKISELQSSGALSQEDKATLEELVAEASTVFVQDNTDKVQPSTSNSTSSQTSTQSVSGVDIQAQLNKLYFSI